MEDTAKEQDYPGAEDMSESEESPGKLKGEIEAKQMAQAEKARAIRKACAMCDVEALAVHATSAGGLLEDDLRQIACEFNVVMVYISAPSSGLN